jgi:hypothetical protein
MSASAQRTELVAQVLFHRVMGADADWDAYPDRPKEGFRGDAAAVLTMLDELNASDAEVARRTSRGDHTHLSTTPLDNCGICQQRERSLAEAEERARAALARGGPVTIVNTSAPRVSGLAGIKAFADAITAEQSRRRRS